MLQIQLSYERKETCDFNYFEYSIRKIREKFGHTLPLQAEIRARSQSFDYLSSIKIFVNADYTNKKPVLVSEGVTTN